MNPVLLDLKNNSPVVFIKLHNTGQSVSQVLLSVEGTFVYNLGVGCDTCPFLFDRIRTHKPAMSSETISQELRNGLKEINADMVSSFAGLLETDEYVVNLLQFIPQFEDPKLTEKEKRAYDYVTGYYGEVLTEFYMGRRWDYDENGSIGEVVLPLTSTNILVKKNRTVL